ncbi:MAG TPA: hypothetical protein VMS22_18710 [Candidatus Eisenbacteria bacterium]|nr:hypothetical protein [Candidatus Eisenbacteria bacterium]
MRRTPTRLLIAAVVVAALSSSASGAALCEKKKGQLLVRDACRKREHPVDTSAFGAAGPRGTMGDPGPAGDPGQFPLRLVDSNGVEVGKIVNFYSVAALVEVTAASLPTPLMLQVYPSGFGSSLDQLAYESADCSGVAYIESFYLPPMGLAPLAPVWGLAAYYATGSARSITTGSYEYTLEGSSCPVGLSPTGRGTCCGTSSGTVSGQVPTARVPLSVFGLVPPFHAVVR